MSTETLAPSAPAKPERKPKRYKRRADDVAGLGKAKAGAFVTPALLLIGMFLVFPAVWTIYLGMTDTRLTGLAAANPQFVGLDNYREILADPKFWNSLWLTVIFVFFSGILGQTVLGLALALMVQKLKGFVKGLVEFLILAAWVVPGTVTAFLWRALLDRRNGTLNAILGTDQTAWLLDYPLIMIILFNIWGGAAFSMQLFSSALASVPPSQIESARMAGASSWQRFTDVVLPNIKGHIFTNTLLITLWTFNVFGPYMLTAGGPNGKTAIISIYIYQVAIPGGFIGLGAAISLIMLVINLVIALIYQRIAKGTK